MHLSGLPKILWGKALRHSTWLKNQTATRALNGKTPFKALYGRPPDLSALCAWGLPVLVHTTNGSKLHARAREACWLGLDIDAKVHHVYWPGTGNVTIERNVYFGTSAQLEGEEEDLPVVSSEQAAVPPNPSTASPPNPPEIPSPAPTDQPKEHEVPLTLLRCSTCTHKPLHTIHDL